MLGSAVFTDRLSIPALEEEIADLAEQLYQASADIDNASLETEACLSGLPSACFVIKECAESLRHARGEVGDLQAEIAARKAHLQHLESHVRCSGRAPNNFMNELALRRHAHANIWLQRHVSGLEVEEMALFHQCQVMSRDVVGRTELERLTLQQDLERQEYRSHLCRRILEDCGQLDTKLRSAYGRRLEHKQEDLEALEETLCRRTAEASKYRDESLEEQRRWEPERETFIQDILRLQENIADMRQSVAQLEMDEEAIGRRRANDDLSAGAATGRAQELQAAVDHIIQHTRTVEQEIATVDERRLATERRSMEILRSEWAACSELEARLRAGGNGRGPAMDAVAAAAATAAAMVGEEARQAGDELRDAHAQAERAEAGLRDALKDLAQQQHMLERQLHGLMWATGSENIVAPRLLGKVG